MNTAARRPRRKYSQLPANPSKATAPDFTAAYYIPQPWGHIDFSAVVRPSIDVTDGKATRLVVTTPPPATATPGAPFAVVVAAEDSLGNVDPTFNGSVTLALTNNSAGATLGGTLTVAAYGGVAAFSGLTISSAGTGFTLQASSSGLTLGTSAAFNVTNDQLVVSTVSSSPSM